MSLKYLYLARFLTKAQCTHSPDFIDLIREERIFTLESFFGRSLLTEVLETYSEPKIFLDSGAYSLENQKVDDIQKYLDDYIDFILKYKNRLLGYANLDDVRNVEVSWKNQKYMEERGVRPIPVYHYGEDFKWMERYLNEYDYVGIGGVARGVSGKALRMLLDRIFDYRSRKNLSVKIHGFGIASTSFMLRYPWFSCDSTTWLQISMYGKIVIPRYSRTKKEFDYSKTPTVVKVSEISEIKSSPHPHYTLLFPEGGKVRAIIEEYFKMAGVDKEKLKVSWHERERAIVYYYEQFLKSECVQQFTEYKGDRTFF